MTLENVRRNVVACNSYEFVNRNCIRNFKKDVVKEVFSILFLDFSISKFFFFILLLVSFFKIFEKHGLSSIVQIEASEVLK